MPELSTENVLVQLQALEWVLSRAGEEGQGAFDVGIWTFFFKIDGSTFQLGSGSDLGKLFGAVTVQTTAGPGRLQTPLRAGVPIPVPPEVGSWSTSISPLHFQGDVLPPVGGVLGLAAVVFYPSTIESDALAAGHDVFNSALEFKLNTLLTTQLQFMFTDDGITLAPTPDQIKKLTSEVSHTVYDAIHDATDVWDKIHTGLTGGGYWFENVFAMVSQQQFGSDPFAQLDLGGSFTFAVETSGGQRPDHLAGLCGAVTRAQPSVTQAVRAHVPHPVSAVAAFSDGTFEHLAVATEGETVTEFWWQDDDAVNQNRLFEAGHSVSALAGFHTSDGVNHVIVGTSSGQVVELYWQGSGSVRSGSLAELGHAVVALAGYQTGDGILHVIAGTSDGDVSELWWWSTGDVTRQHLTRRDHPIIDLVAFASSDGVQHVVVAELGNQLTELWWQGASEPSSGPLGDARGQGQPASIFLDSEWRTLIGLGGYFLEPEHHVITVLSNGAIRDVRWALGDSSATHHDVLVLPAADLWNRGGGIGPLVDSFVDRRGIAHTIVAMPDGDLSDVQILPPNPIMIFVGGH